MLDAEKFITTIRIKLLQLFPWYGHVLTQLPVVYTTTEVPTLGVGKANKNETLVKLYINPTYIEHVIKICGSNEERVVSHFLEVMKHEVHHLVFAHLTLDMQDKYRQMIACELSVNSYINRNKLVSEEQKEAGVFAEDFKLESKLGVHEYYRLLDENKHYKEMMKKGDDSGDSGDKDGKGEGKNKSNGKANNGGGNKCLDDHGKWKDIADDELTKEMIRDVIRQANETCKQMGQWGDIPGEIKQAIDENYKNEKNIIPWQIVLRNFLASSSENRLDYTMKKKSKRFDTRPGTRKEEILDVAIGIDTSGSVSDEMLKMFFSELDWMSKVGTKMTVFEWDTKINAEYDFRYYEGVVTGRGGTDPIPALEEICSRRFDCLIMFTDFGFDKIKEEYNIPILWVVDNNGYDSSYIPVEDGIILKVNDDRDGFSLVDY